VTSGSNKRTVKTGYNAIAAQYLATRTEDSADVQLLGELIQRLARGAHVLDAGCGAGVPVTRILSRFFRVTGVDFSEAQIELARQLVPDAQFVCQDMTELTFPDNSFDAVVSYYAIIHIPREEHRQLLANFYRMLKPEGLVLLCLGAGDLVDDVDDFLGTSMYWSHYDAETNLNLVLECGFEVIWARMIGDSLDPSARHLFVLAQKH
jgi:ubiquinone/menaquinone biosynthesis C-methylase UbiE